MDKRRNQGKKSQNEYEAEVSSAKESKEEEPSKKDKAKTIIDKNYGNNWQMKKVV